MEELGQELQDVTSAHQQHQKSSEEQLRVATDTIRLVRNTMCSIEEELVREKQKGLEMEQLHGDSLKEETR